LGIDGDAVKGSEVRVFGFREEDTGEGNLMTKSV